MVSVTVRGVVRSGVFLKRIEGRKVILEFSGHSGFSVRGCDPVCAAVSILFETLSAAFSIRNIPYALQKRDDGYIFEIDYDSLEESNKTVSLVILDTILIGLEGTAFAEKEHVEIRYD